MSGRIARKINADYLTIRRRLYLILLCRSVSKKYGDLDREGPAEVAQQLSVEEQYRAGAGVGAGFKPALRFTQNTACAVAARRPRHVTASARSV